MASVKARKVQRRFTIEPLERRELLSVTAGGDVSAGWALLDAFIQSAQGAASTAFVEGTVWHDANRDGIRQADETLLSGITVQLYRLGGEEDSLADDQLLAETVTTPEGHYSFTQPGSDIAPEDCYVRIEPPAGYWFTLQNQGNDDTIDSDVMSMAGIGLLGFNQSGQIDAGLVNPGPQIQQLGVVEYVELAGQQPELGQLRYELFAIRTGILSVAVSNYDGPCTIAVLDEQGRLIGGTAVPEQVDVEVQAGQHLWINIADLTGPVDVVIGNLLQFEGDQQERLYVFGTARADQMVFNLESPRTLTVNSLRYVENTEEENLVHEVYINGFGGADHIELIGTDGTDLMMATPYFVAGLFGLEKNYYTLLLASSVEDYTIDTVEGIDSVKLQGALPTAAEQLQISPNQALWQAGQFRLELQNIDNLTAQTFGNNDTLWLRSETATAQLQFWADDSYVQFTAQQPGADPFRAEVEGFRWINADGQDGVLEATLFGQEGSIDKLLAQYWRVYFTTSEQTVCRVDNASSIMVNAQAEDSGIIFDSPGDDIFQGLPLSGSFTWDTTSSVQLQYSGLSNLTIRASDGYDRAVFSDNGLAERNILVVKHQEQFARYYGSQFRYYAFGFEEVVANSTSGQHEDRAYIYDHDGDEQFTFYAAPDLFNPNGGTNRLAGTRSDGQFVATEVSGFGQVYVYATRGGNDTAQLYGNPQAPDRFYAAPTWALMYGQGYYARMIGFEAVSAHAAGSDDLAVFYDSSGDDHFEAWHNLSQINYGAGITNSATAEGFRWVKAFASSGGNDIADLFGRQGTNEKLSITMNSKTATLSNSGHYYLAKGFETTRVWANSGDNDLAYAWDSAGDDLLLADGQTNPSAAILQAIDQVFELYEMSYLRATSSAGGTDTKQIIHPELLDFVLDAQGNWQNP